MRRTRSLVALLAAVVMIFTLSAVTARADPAVYTTPGGHLANGRLWRTDCEPYSSTVVRCRTEIWATVVQFRRGEYVQTDAWTFNNLTYLASPEANWEGNPLATDGEWTAADGRQWRTECNTETTGADACRSYALVRTVSSSPGPQGRVFQPEMTWVFNNMVRFSTSSVPWQREVPAHVLETSALTHTGLGPLQIGTPMADLQRLGYVFHRSADGCQAWEPNHQLRSMGVSIRVADGQLSALVVSSPAVGTTRGVAVGDPFSEAEAAYADMDFHHDLKTGQQPVYTFASDLGANEMVFVGSTRDTVFPEGNSSIGMLVVRPIAPDLSLGGC